MLIRGFNGVIEFPKTNLFIADSSSMGKKAFYIVPVIRSRQWLINVTQPFAVYSSYERASAIIDMIITEYVVGKKVFTMPPE